jgi:hypothetical protein
MCERVRCLCSPYFAFEEKRRNVKPSRQAGHTVTLTRLLEERQAPENLNIFKIPGRSHIKASRGNLECNTYLMRDILSPVVTYT